MVAVRLIIGIPVRSRRLERIIAMGVFAIANCMNMEPMRTNRLAARRSGPVARQAVNSRLYPGAAGNIKKAYLAPQPRRQIATADFGTGPAGSICLLHAYHHSRIVFLYPMPVQQTG